MKIWKRVTALLLAVVLSVSMTSCTWLQDYLKPEWDDLTRELFVSTMKADTLTMHFFIDDPASFEIYDYDETLGSLEYNEDDTWASDALEMIEMYDPEDLTEEQQYEYEILHWYLSTEEMCEDLDYYMELAEPTYGIQANYPINMADYAIDDEEDINHYFELLEDTPRFFEELLAYEQERAGKGFCMTDVQLDRMLEDCRSFIGERLEENVLITSFTERLIVLDISDDLKAKYMTENSDYVQNDVIPAYEKFMEGMAGLKGTNTGSGSIAEYPEGKAYYEYLARSASSSDRSVEEMKKLLTRYIQQQMVEIGAILNENYALIDQMENVDYGAEDPVDILELIAGRMGELVPEIQADYTVRYVPRSLQESLSPAFCYVPQIDNVESVIYINENPEYDNMDFYTTVAHEGYPGHMYQNTYFYGTDPAWFRHILPFVGYKEGWACYISYKALQLSDIQNEDLIQLLWMNEAIGYELSALADIGVNYEGWSIAELKDFYASYGYELTDEEAEEQYHMLMDSPGGYLSYSVSCCEFWELESYTRMKLKQQYDEKEFHQVLLEAGPVSFSILRDQVDQYIKYTKSK